MSYTICALTVGAVPSLDNHNAPLSRWRFSASHPCIKRRRSTPLSHLPPLHEDASARIGAPHPACAQRRCIQYAGEEIEEILQRIYVDLIPTSSTSRRLGGMLVAQRVPARRDPHQRHTGEEIPHVQYHLYRSDSDGLDQMERNTSGHRRIWWCATRGGRRTPRQLAGAGTQSNPGSGVLGSERYWFDDSPHRDSSRARDVPRSLELCRRRAGVHHETGRCARSGQNHGIRVEPSWLDERQRQHDFRVHRQ